MGRVRPEDHSLGESRMEVDTADLLMRIAPLAFTGASDEQIKEVLAITHAHEISKVARLL